MQTKKICELCREAPCECGMFKIPYGKHKGERIMDVHDEDPSYLSWCLATMGDNDLALRIEAYLEEA